MFVEESVRVRTPTKIQALTVTLQLSWEGEKLVESAKFKLYIHDQDGVQMAEQTGLLAPHNTAQENQQLSAYMAAKYAQAVAEVLP